MLKGKFIPFEVETDCTSRRTISIGDLFGEVSKQLRILKTLTFLAMVYSFVSSSSKDDKPLWTVNVTEIRSEVLGDVEEPECRL